MRAKRILQTEGADGQEAKMHFFSRSAAGPAECDRAGRVILLISDVALGPYGF